MPIILEAPIPRANVTAKEIVHFVADLRTMTVYMTFANIDENGAKVSVDPQVSCALVDGNGSRFTPEEYASIKTALYRLALEDGHVAGTVA